MFIGRVLTIIPGAVLVGAKLNDAHTKGVMKGDVYTQMGDAEGLTRSVLNYQTLDQPNVLADNAKKWLLKADMNSNIRKPFNFIHGYLTGFGTMLINNVVPIALGTGAIVTGLMKDGKSAAEGVAAAAKKGAGGAAKGLRKFFAAASAIWLAGSIVTGLIGTNNKHSLDSGYGYK